MIANGHITKLVPDEFSLNDVNRGASAAVALYPAPVVTSPRALAPSPGARHPYPVLAQTRTVLPPSDAPGSISSMNIGTRPVGHSLTSFGHCFNPCIANAIGLGFATVGKGVRPGNSAQTDTPLGRRRVSQGNSGSICGGSPIVRGSTRATPSSRASAPSPGARHLHQTPARPYLYYRRQVLPEPFTINRIFNWAMVAVLLMSTVGLAGAQLPDFAPAPQQLVPEPGTLTLVGMGLVGMLTVLRRSRT